MWPDGARFQGRFEKGKKKYGTLIWANGNVYTGEFSNDVMKGWGKFQWADGKKEYEGNFSDNEMNGNGTLTWFDDDHNITCIYIGKFRFHQIKDLSGEAVMIWPDSRIFIGKFENGV